MSRIVLATLLALTLAACGGGDWDEESPDTMPVDCKAQPQACR